ncbi:MAG TPA: hypothetical protein VMV46_03660 [Thermoanaerobaculia bacterium]|nr:hypothetical protein [Thermoanaerobaculia bacterium]
MSERERVEIELEETEASKPDAGGSDDDGGAEAGERSDLEGGEDLDEGDDESERVLVVDLEKPQSRKKIKRLRQGRGPLMDKVYEVLDELHASGYLADEVQPVVIVVREKREKRSDPAD